MSTWDTEKLKSDINCITLAKDLGIDIQKKGTTYFCKCLVHNERTASMQINPTFLYCHGCGKSLNAIDLCMIWENVSFQDACKFLCDYLGGSSDYSIDHVTNNIFPLSKKELEAIGLIPVLKKRLVNHKRELIELSNNEFEYQDISIDAGIYGISTLYKDNKLAFWTLVYNKCLEHEWLSRRAIRQYTQNQSLFEDSIIRDIETKLDLINKIKKKFPKKYQLLYNDIVTASSN